MWGLPLGLIVKGDYHKTISNTAIDLFPGSTTMIRILDESGQAQNSETYNNLGSITSSRNGYAPLVGTLHGNNWNPFEETGQTRDHVRDWRNLDFRPVAGSPVIDGGISYPPYTDDSIGTPDIGAYEYGNTHYWIPGYQSAESSTPVPPDGTITAKTDCDLMWLTGLEAVSHDVYFGTSPDNLVFQGNYALANNIFDPGTLGAEQTYYWRVDAVTAAGMVTGPVWHFTTLPAVPPAPEEVILLADAANSSTSGFGGSVERTLNDSFAYGPESPTSPLPYLIYDPGDVKGFHGDEASGIATVAYTSAGGALSLAPSEVFIVDLYGRSDCCGDRDDNFDIKLYNGQTLVASSAGNGIDGDYHGRVTMSPAAPFNRVVIVGYHQYFTLMEIRAAIEYVPGLNQSPSFNVDPLIKKDAKQGIAYSGTLAGDATDHDGDPLTFSKVSGPAWLNITPDGTLSGTPDASDISVNIFTVQVDDGYGVPDAAILKITVRGPNNAPVFDAEPIVDEVIAYMDRPYSSTLSNNVTNPDNDTLIYSKISGPAWLTVVENGALTGTPGEGDMGTNVFTVEVTDGYGGTDQAVVNVEVALGPEEVVLLADAASSSVSGWGGSVERTLNDSFAYDPLSPSSPLPYVTYDPGDIKGFHGNEASGAVTLSYDLADGPLSVDPSKAFVVDLYGRADEQDRDDNFTIEVYNGQTLVASSAGNAIDADCHGRVAMYPTAPFDRIVIVGYHQYFTLMEIRAAVIIRPQEVTLLSDPANSSTSGWGGSIERTLNDPFAYDPLSPTSPLPYLIYDNDDVKGFHGDEASGVVTLSYDPADGLLSLAPSQTFVVDLYGRDDFQDRDDNFDIELYDGQVLVTSLIGNMIDGDSHGRVVISPTAPFDRIVIVGYHQYFTLMEIRAAKEGNLSPAFSADPINKPNAAADVAYSDSIAGDADDPDDDPLTFSKLSGPTWLNVASDGTLSGTPAGSDWGANAFTVRVDATGGSDAADLQITVYSSFSLEEFTVLAENWQRTCSGPDWCERTDMDFNGKVDLIDLVNFIQHWIE